VSLLCPNCHRPFTKEITKREPVKAWEHEPEHFDGEEFCRTQTCPSTIDRAKEVVEFMHYCSCKHCRHEWTETKTVEFEV